MICQSRRSKIEILNEVISLNLQKELSPLNFRSRNFRFDKAPYGGVKHHNMDESPLVTKAILNKQLLNERC